MRHPSRVPWPALALAAVVLLPFFGKAYTIDDPAYLNEARHVLTDPRHPTAFELVWNSGRRFRASAILPGGPMAGYLLVPLGLAGWQEWAGHLLMLGVFAVTILATAALARRLGLSPWAQQAAALLAASAPVALGMAGTVMPDLPATMFGVLGINRFVAWDEGQRHRDGVLAGLWLALAALTRVHLLVLLPVAGAYALFRAWRGALPVALAFGLVLAGSMLTRDPDPSGGTATTAALWLLRLDQSGRHLMAFAIAYLTTTPVLLAVVTRPRHRHSALLWGWLLVPLPIVTYIHFAPKYVLPAVPAVVILAAHGLDRLPWRSALLAIGVAAGVVLGVLILRADARLAGDMRAAAAELIRPRVRAGERVWFAGHWGFHWYAEAAGAQPLSFDPPLPAPGDIVVSSTVDRAWGPLPTLPKTLLRIWGSVESGGQIMSHAAHAGFYSDTWGLLPWSWGLSDGPGFQVWRVTP